MSTFSPLAHQGGFGRASRWFSYSLTPGGEGLGSGGLNGYANFSTSPCCCNAKASPDVAIEEDIRAHAKDPAAGTKTLTQGGAGGKTQTTTPFTAWAGRGVDGQMYVETTVRTDVWVTGMWKPHSML